MDSMCARPIVETMTEGILKYINVSCIYLEEVDLRRPQAGGRPSISTKVDPQMVQDSGMLVMLM